MNASWKFSLLVFAPVMVVFLLPAMFLLPMALLTTLLAIFDPTVPLSDAAAISLWVIGPLTLSFALLLVARGLYALFQHGRSSRTLGTLAWTVFILALFLALWIGITLLGSVGASDKPPLDYLRTTALCAAGMTLLAQVLVVPWLIVILNMLIRSGRTVTVAPDATGGEHESKEQSWPLS